MKIFKPFAILLANRIKEPWEVQHVIFTEVLIALAKRGCTYSDSVYSLLSDKKKYKACFYKKMSKEALFELSQRFNLKDEHQFLGYISRIEEIFLSESRPDLKRLQLNTLLHAIARSPNLLPISILEKKIALFISIIKEWRTHPYLADSAVDSFLAFELYPSIQSYLESSSHFKDLINSLWMYARDRHEGPRPESGSGDLKLNDYVNVAVIALVKFRNPLCREALEEFAHHRNNYIKQNAKVGLEWLSESK